MPEGMQGFNGWLVDGAVFPKIQMGQLFVSTVYVALFPLTQFEDIAREDFYSRNEFDRVNFGLN